MSQVNFGFVQMFHFWRIPFFLAFEIFEFGANKIIDCKLSKILSSHSRIILGTRIIVVARVVWWGFRESIYKYYFIKIEVKFKENYILSFKHKVPVKEISSRLLLIFSSVHRESIKVKVRQLGWSNVSKHLDTWSQWQEHSKVCSHKPTYSMPLLSISSVISRYYF